MCGIIGIVGQKDAADRLVDGLRRMEYRGYDSAGLCTLHDGQLVRRRAEGKLLNLVGVLAQDPAPGCVGIAHTRWATHGAPTANNAHPHATAEVALVHNASSKISNPCAKNWKRAAGCSKARPTARWWPTFCPNR